MTPVLYGRWQTRLFLLGTIGALLTALFGYFFQDYRTPFALLGYVFLFGLFWDWIYQMLTRLRWDRDWPPLFAFAAGLWEGLFLFALVRLVGLPGVDPAITTGQFVAHYGTVFIVVFLESFALMHILFPHWRFNGGKWL